MHQLLALPLAAAAALLLGLGLAGPASSSTVEPPPGDTIVDVNGDRDHGFEVRYYDGTSLYPPTGSEARAECSEYDTRVARVRCRTAVRVWYRDLADLKQALDWARTQA